MRASDEVRWAVAVELDDSSRVPVLCKQKAPGAHCSEPVDYVCDGCGKLVCITHRHAATMPRAVERDPDAAKAVGVLDRWPRNAYGEPVAPQSRCLAESDPDLCTTCRRLERLLGKAFEEISETERRDFLFSEAASGYVGPFERAAFPDLCEYHARIHGKERPR